jgi:hypothetical protein
MQEAIDQQMTPYKQRMTEKLNRLNQEMMDEEMVYIEEEYTEKELERRTRS